MFLSCCHFCAFTASLENFLLSLITPSPNFLTHSSEALTLTSPAPQNPLIKVYEHLKQLMPPSFLKHFLHLVSKPPSHSQFTASFQSPLISPPACPSQSLVVGMPQGSTSICFSAGRHMDLIASQNFKYHLYIFLTMKFSSL